MAKGNRTTSKALPARVAKVTFTPRQAAENICGLEDDAHAEAFGLQHLGALLVLFGEHIGAPGADWDGMDTQKIGLRVEYLGSLVKRHADATSDTLGKIRSAAERLERGQ
jgi:hypothetical protein